MFSAIKKRWKEARAQVLRKEAEDAIVRLNALPEEVNVRAAETLAKSYHYLSSEVGPFENVSNDGKIKLSKMLNSKAKKAFEMDMGQGYGIALLAMHLESSCLPGYDAKFVYESTLHFIMSALDTEDN